MRDDLAMERARQLGESARRVAPPNPWVGCVIVRDGEIVGEGSTQAPGHAHAEVAALTAAGDRARGATAYVTLEPCSHHGRTPPCADALVAAGVARVVVGITDPDERVSGAGVARLHSAGVAVEAGVAADGITRDLAPYLHHRRTGRAFCVVKTATTLDGRSAAADGTSQWITGPAARADAHALRAESQAVVVGAGTAIRDLPSLTARNVEPPVAQQPLRVLLDARGRVAAVGPLFDAELAPTLVITTEGAAPDTVDDWRHAGAKVEVVDAAPGGVDLGQVLTLLGRYGVLQAMVEGGATLHGALLDAQLVDRVVAYVAPALLGPEGAPALPLAGVMTLADARRFTVTSVAQLADDVRLDLEPVR